jgi:ribosomal protein S17
MRYNVPVRQNAIIFSFFHCLSFFNILFFIFRMFRNCQCRNFIKNIDRNRRKNVKVRAFYNSSLIKLQKYDSYDKNCTKNDKKVSGAPTGETVSISCCPQSKLCCYYLVINNLFFVPITAEYIFSVYALSFSI